MILSQPDLRDLVEKGEIVFEPAIEEKQWGEASVDLRLGFSFTKIEAIRGIRLSVADGLGAISNMKIWSTQDLKEFDKFGKREKFDIDRSRPGTC